MTWLTRLELDKEAMEKQEIYDSYAWHQAAWNCFPEDADAKRDFLTRIDMKQNTICLLIVSERKPCRPSWCAENQFLCITIAESFLEQKLYRFDLLANPTRKLKTYTEAGERKKNGSRVGVITQEEQRSWLESKGTQHGFCLLQGENILIDSANNQPFLRKAQSGVHVAVRFRGILQVTNSQLFKEAFMKGIGSAKSFGFGMVLLQPIISE